MKKFLEAYERISKELSESIKKTITRGKDGRVNISYKSTRPGYRVKQIRGRPVEVRMSPIERRHRSEAARKSAKKRKTTPKIKKARANVKKKAPKKRTL